MKYLIGTVFLVIFFCFAAALTYCGYRAFTDDITWGFVMLGLTLPTAVCLLITQAAFQGAREY